MSYESQRGGVSAGPDVTAPYEVQKDGDGPGFRVAGGTGLPGGQGQDQPLMQVGTYARPDCALDTSILTSDQQNVKKAGGTVGGAMRTVGLT